ncbi:hypothetical protein D3C73_185630 [compost metagenome]
MSKKLTSATINKLNKELDKKKTIYILGEYEVNINLVFNESKIDKVVFDYLSMFEEVNKNNEFDEEFIRGTLAILNTFILREFSDVPMIPSDRNVQKLIQVSKALYNTGIMEEVMVAFDQEQLNKVFEKLQTGSKRVGELMGEYAIKDALNSGDDIENSEES